LAWKDRQCFAIVALALAVAMLHGPRPSLAQDPTGKAAVAGDGQLAFNNACRTCHTIREGDNRLGPNLHKILGRKAGSLPNYGYSSAMKGADFVWDQATLDRFIANPDQVVARAQHEALWRHRIGRGSRQNRWLSRDHRPVKRPKTLRRLPFAKV
jgi:cytochrome c